MYEKSNGFHTDVEAMENSRNFPSKYKGKKSVIKGPYLMGDTIGEGAFAKVKLAIHIQTKEKVAIKIIDKEKTFKKEEDIIRVEKEIDILKKLKHNNIIQLYEIMESKKNLYIVMEYCDGKELFEYIVNKKKLNENEAVRIFQEIINAVEYLHENNITHRDLKPENLLLDSKRSIKISDFGLSTIKSCEESFLNTPCGTPNYAPPEMLKGDSYNGVLSDIWSCGIILYAMLCGYLPFHESQEQIIYEKIMNHDYEYPSFLSKQVVDLLKNILKIEPQERYSFEQIKRHSWFNKIVPKLSLGINLDILRIPIDDKILKKVENMGYNKELCRENLLANKYDNLTTVYFLILKRFVREGGKSISDMNSKEYINYIKKEQLKIRKRNLEVLNKNNLDYDIAFTDKVEEGLKNDNENFIDNLMYNNECNYNEKNDYNHLNRSKYIFHLIYN
jgi:5'-AMP-activated protein kinase catalytic alpha subunit